MKTKAMRRFQDLPKDYESLCRVLLPRPVRDAVDYELSAHFHVSPELFVQPN